MPKTEISRNTFLSFRLGEEIFAVNVSKVLEVLEIQKITQIPRMPRYMRGVISFRGEVLPVIDTRLKFRMPHKEDTSKTVIIVLELKPQDKTVMLGAIADAVKDVILINDGEIKPVPSINSHYNAEFLLGMYKTDEGFIMILDVDKVFSIAEIDMVNGIIDDVELDE